MTFEEAKPQAQQRTELDKKNKLKETIISDTLTSMSFVYDFSLL
jgi:hypothetical protein